MVRFIVQNSFTGQWVELKNLVKVISANSISEVCDVISKIESLVNESNLFAGGFISYDAAPAFDASLLVNEGDGNFPLVWFGLFEDAAPFVFNESSSIKSSLFWNSSVEKDTYNSAIASIKNSIKEGDTYQVNYTMRQYADFYISALDFFQQLCENQQASYSTFIETEDFAVCSASPELFFTYDNGLLISKPMKGTISRGRDSKDDLAQKQWLLNSEKNRAENLMIVDMIRNDLGKVSKAGSVRVPKLFEVEKYPTVWQMTSTVTSISNASVLDILKAVFPCASITGAPKVSTMKIIKNLESSSRGIYTGAIGFLTPDKKAQFNVAIRTVSIDKKHNKAVYGVGGGIVWDSTDKDEFEECRIKTKFLTERKEKFNLFETILWSPDSGYFLLDYHLKRLKESAEYFDFMFKIKKITDELEKRSKLFTLLPLKVKLILEENGAFTIEFSELGYSFKKDKLILKLLPNSVSSDNAFLYHKTSNRAHYEKLKTSNSEYDDVIFCNERGEVTESSIANIVIKVDNKLFTPPIESGLLNGTFRQYLIDKEELTEKTITKDMLLNSKSTYLINSVRKWMPVEKIDP